jgi:flagellar basal body rod protein FlgB
MCFCPKSADSQELSELHIPKLSLMSERQKILHKNVVRSSYANYKSSDITLRETTCNARRNGEC